MRAKRETIYDLWKGLTYSTNQSDIIEMFVRPKYVQGVQMHLTLSNQRNYIKYLVPIKDALVINVQNQQVLFIYLFL